MIEATVRGIALEKESRMPLVLLQEKDGKRTLPVWIGPSEASSIIVEMEGVLPPRLLTHDLITLFFQRHNFRLLSLEIYGRAEDVYLARIRYKKGLKEYSVDLRPSDGLALAVRLKAPILCGAGLFSSPEGLQEADFSGEISAELLFLENS